MTQVLLQSNTVCDLLLVNILVSEPGIRAWAEGIKLQTLLVHESLLSLEGRITRMGKVSQYRLSRVRTNNTLKLNYDYKCHPDIFTKFAFRSRSSGWAELWTADKFPLWQLPPPDNFPAMDLNEALKPFTKWTEQCGLWKEIHIWQQQRHFGAC